MTPLSRLYNIALGTACMYAGGYLVASTARVDAMQRAAKRAPKIDWEDLRRQQIDHIDESCRTMDRAAGVAHGHVGDDPLMCALCYMPRLHPIHVVDVEQAVRERVVVDDVEDAEIVDLTKPDES